MRPLLLTTILTACAAAAPPPSVVVTSSTSDAILSPALDATCSIVAKDVLVSEPIALHLGKKTFARIGTRASVVVGLREGTAGGTAAVETADVALVGEVSPRDIVLAPENDAVRDGFWRVKNAHARSVSGRVVTLDVQLPSIVHPKRAPALSLPCNEVSIASWPDPPGGRELRVLVRDGVSVPLRLAPSGAVVAQIEVPVGAADDVRKAFELEHLGGSTRIRISTAAVDVEGWVPTSALDPLFGDEIGDAYGVGAGRGFRCAHDVPLFVESGARQVRVGSWKAHTWMAVERGRLDLGGDEPVLVRAESIADCSEGPL